MPFFGVPIRNGLPIGLGSVAGFGVQQFDPSQLFSGGAEGAWYDPSDLSTLFQDTAGTTPAVMPGGGSAVPVGLMLDKSKGLVLGPELVTNGDFSQGSTGWTLLGTATISGGVAIINSSSSSDRVQQAGVIPANKFVQVEFDLVVNSGGVAFLDLLGGNTQNFTTSGKKSFIAFSSTATGIQFFRSAVSGSFNGTIDNISVKALPGNHAISYNTTTTRPELSARVNLLTYSEQFDNAAWGKTAATVANTAVTTDPLGGNTADILTDNAVNTEHRVFQNAVIAAGTYTWSFWAKANTLSWLHLGLPNAAGTRQDIYFDVGNGVVGTVPAGYTASISSAGNGWWRCVVTGATLANTYLLIATSTANNVQSYAGTGQSLYIWGADLRPANIGANVPAYQRIADANTYDTNGFPLYLRFDGSDDAMYTPANLDLTSTDKATVFAGVRKLSDAAQDVVAELSATIATNNGTFLLAAPDGATQTYGWDSKGTTQVDAVATGFAAPITNVVTGTADIAGDSCIIRVNGTVADTETGDQGSGNYGTYPLYIGARAGTGSFLNGYLYGLTVVGSQLTTPQIEAMESWTAGKTGISIP